MILPEAFKNGYVKVTTAISHFFSRENFRNSMKSEYFIIGVIIIFAYLIRVLPYLLGYDLPFAEEGMRDYQQVLYLISHNAPNLFGSYFDYGAFPILHLIIFVFYKLGADSLCAFLFIPQAFAAAGIFFYYLFLRKYFKPKESLLACFLIAAFEKFDDQLTLTDNKTKEAIKKQLEAFDIWIRKLSA
jgi:hypothetical protein